MLKLSPVLLSCMMKCEQLQLSMSMGLMRYFHCSQIVSIVKKDGTAYNYGLPGKGKGSKSRISKPSSQHPAIRTQGEVLFGIHPVTLALTSHHRSHFYQVYMDRKHGDSGGRSSRMLDHIQGLANRQQIPVQFVPKAVLTHLSGNRPHQGVCLDASPRLPAHCDLLDLFQGIEVNSSSLWLLLYGIQDPMNFGAILRSCFFLGVDRVLVPSTNSCALSPVVSKASAGALEVIDIHEIDGNFRTMQQLTEMWRGQGGQVVGTSSESDCSQQVVSLHDFKVSGPTLVIVGNEGSGIDEDVIDLCDTLLTIPCLSSTHDAVVTSLNVSVATGILIHWLRASTKTS